MSALIALSAALVAAGFAASLAGRFRKRGGAHNLFWAISLAMFALASAALAFGLGAGWSSAVFGIYYLFGAILNVPFLGLGQVYLLWPDRVSYVVAVGVLAFSLAATVTVLTAPMTNPPKGSGFIPAGREVYATQIPEEKLPPACLQPGAAARPECDRAADPLAIWPRIFAVVGNVLGTLLVLIGTLSAAVRLIEKRNRTAAGARIALGNLGIAAGVMVVASGGTGARFGKTWLLPFTLALGVSVMYGSFRVATSAKEATSEGEDRLGEGRAGKSFPEEGSGENPRSSPVQSATETGG